MKTNDRSRRNGLFETDERVPEIIEPEENEVSSHKRIWKPKATYEEQFDDLPVRQIPHSYVSNGLAAHVMYAKFINAMPYYRREKDFENQFGIKISCGTMAHWIIYCAQNYFSPMIGYFHRRLAKRKFVAGDDGEPPIIIYQYHLIRNGNAAAELFEDSTPGLTSS